MYPRVPTGTLHRCHLTPCPGRDTAQEAGVSCDGTSSTEEKQRELRIVTVWRRTAAAASSRGYQEARRGDLTARRRDCAPGLGECQRGAGKRHHLVVAGTPASPSPL